MPGSRLTHWRPSCSNRTSATGPGESMEASGTGTRRSRLASLRPWSRHLRPNPHGSSPALGTCGNPRTPGRAPASRSTRRWAGALFALCGLALTAQAEEPGLPAPDPTGHTSAVPREPLPNVGDGDRLTDTERQWLQDGLARWRSLPPDRQARVLEHLNRFRQMPSEERARLIDRLQNFEGLPPEQRAALREGFRRFQQLPPEERAAWRERFRDLPPEERAAWRERLRNLSPEERAAWRERLRNLPPEERAAWRERFRDRSSKRQALPAPMERSDQDEAP
ncbi:MAG TPA: hypothetical protein DCY89_00635 [Gammaproteobacteria bacterium]|nr:hypothetical protein [Gammaproteobacteria bacterium]